MNSREIVIVGAGPAGIACAIQLKRYGIAPLLIEKGEIGGLLRNANLVENYLGFPCGISGVGLVELLREHLRVQGIKTYAAEVSTLDLRKNSFVLHTTKDTLEASIVVIATGTEPKKLDGIAISKDVEDLLFYEVYPLREEKGGEIVIVGAGDAAFDYALNLSRNNQVVILNRRATPKCLPLLFERVQRAKNISYLENASLKEVWRTERGLGLKYRRNAGEEKLSADFLLAAIGREPNLGFLSKKIEKNLYQLQNAGKIYIIGDVTNGICRQVSIAAGDGIRTAMRIYNSAHSQKIRFNGG